MSSARLIPVLLAGAILSSPALAVTPLQTTVTVNPAQVNTNAQTVTVTAPNAAASTTSPVSASSVNVAQFNTANGILTGATISVNTAISTTAQVTATVPNNGSNRTAQATSTMTGTVSVAGTTFSSGAVTASRQCSGGNCLNSLNNNSNTTAGTIVGTQSVSGANLGLLAGTGNVAFTRAATGTTTISRGANANPATANGFFTFGGATAASNVYSITYDYVNFANASFDGMSNVTSLDLDFGTKVLGSGPFTLNFSLFNIGNANTADLALTSFSRSSSDARFSTDLTLFNDLAGGASRTFSMVFNPTTLGIATDMFTLNLADFIPGGIGGRNYTISLKTTGNIVAPPPPPPPGPTVPEPATWALMIAGFGMVGAAMRRRERVTRVAA